MFPSSIWIKSDELHVAHNTASGDPTARHKTVHSPHLRGLIIASIVGISLKIELLET